MTTFRPRRPARIGAAVASLLFAVAGCGDTSGLPPRYSVSGTVNYNGAPVEQGKIDFVPTSGDGRAASGSIEKGSYSLTTLNPGDGALPGKYKVTVTSIEADTTELKAIAKGGQFHHDKAFAKAVKNAKKNVPSKYSLPTTTDLEAEVKPQSNSIPFELKD